MTSWIDIAYIVVALLGIGMCIYVMQKTEHDRINKVDPPLLQTIRRMAFIVVSLALCYSILTILYREWSPSLPVLFLVASGVCNLTVNAVALAMRAPPGRGKLNVIGFQIKASNSRRRIEEIRSRVNL